MSTRVDELLAEMTLDEKIAQLGGVFAISLIGQDARPSPERMQTALAHGIGHVSMASLLSGDVEGLAAANNAIQRQLIEETRLGIPAVVHNEMLCGLMFGPAHFFPTAINLAATWRPDLVERMADVTRRQARAVGIHHALSPVLDVARDARWGRVHESYGEDPHLCAAMGVAFVRGLQGEDLASGVVATGKHFLGYGLTEGALNQSAAHIGTRELYEVFALPFEAAIREAGLASIMNAYNDVDGVPVAASREILTDLLRGRLGFEGVVVADYGSVMRTWNVHHAAESKEEAAALAVEAGLDLELPQLDAYKGLRAMLEAGLVDAKTLDTSVRRVLEHKRALGLLDGPDAVYVDLGAASRCYPLAGAEALEAEIAAASIVLLENDGILPLANPSRIAVVGPLGDTLRGLFAGYSPGAGAEMNLAMAKGLETSMEGLNESIGGTGDDEKPPTGFQAIFQSTREVVPREQVEQLVRGLYPGMRSVAEAIAAAAPEATVIRVRGCDWTVRGANEIAAAAQAAGASDVTVCVVGEKTGWVGDATGGEGRDRATLTLPGDQVELVEAVLATGTPTILVLVNGRALDVGALAEGCAAVVEAFHPARLGGDVIADVLFGRANPGGKLPFSFPPTAGAAPVYHSPRSGSGTATGRPYVDGPSRARWAFGHGLSYTSFGYDALEIEPAEVAPDGRVRIACDVTNTGERAGDEVVQLYLRDLVASTTRPIQQLGGFLRVPLEPGETKRVCFDYDVTQLCLVDRDHRLVVEPGEIRVRIGSSSRDLRLEGGFRIVGPVLELPHRRSFTTPSSA